MEINFETIDFENPANKIINDIFNHSYSEKYNRDYEILGRTAMFEYVNELLSLQYISKQTKETIEKIYDNLMGMSQEELILFYFEICQDSSDDSYFAKAPRPLHYSFFKYSTDRKIKIKYEDDCTLQVLYRISNKENNENKVYFGDYFDALMIESEKRKQEDLKKDNFYKSQTKKNKDDYSKIIFGCKEKLDDLENDSTDEYSEVESTTLKNNESELFSKINSKNPKDLINIELYDNSNFKSSNFDIINKINFEGNLYCKIRNEEGKEKYYLFEEAKNSTDYDKLISVTDRLLIKVLDSFLQDK